MIKKQDHNKPTLLIYTDRLLPPSETFIRNQTEAITRFDPYYVGSRRVTDGLAIPDDRVLVANGRGQASRVIQYVQLRLTGQNGTVRLAGRLKSLEPKLMFAHFGPSAGNAIPLARKLKIPLVAYFHGDGATMTQATAQKTLYNRVWMQHREDLKQAGTLFLAVSDYLRDRVIDLGFPRDKVMTHYIGQKLPASAPRPLSERKNFVLFVGRLVEKKGAEYLIKAMAKVQQTRPDMELVIVGDGELRPELERLAHHTLKRCQFVGWQTNEQVMEWMNTCRIFSLPSVTAASGHTEGLPMVITEAQSIGTPVVSTYHSGIPECVIHGKTGLLAPERDADTLAEHILKLSNDDDFWNACHTASPTHIRDNFDLTKQTAKLEDIFMSVIGAS